ncbi:MAG: hypothetical protein IPL78_09855 [Chloroflexi bacterium]|nr:hypothetical protein [Chloroflexota bacterium]
MFIHVILLFPETRLAPQQGYMPDAATKRGGDGAKTFVYAHCLYGYRLVKHRARPDVSLTVG